MCADLLGMSKVMSDESVRRALKKCDGARLDAWLTRHEREVTESLLQFAYVLDVDNAVKTIYGHQEGAELGYNPHKPGRPSYNYHTFFVGAARMTLGVEVLPGKQHSGRCGMPWLGQFLDGLPRNRWPRLLRGDVGYGGEEIMADAESRAIRHLFKIRRSRNVCALFRRLEFSSAWKDCAGGWHCIDTFIRPDGWTTTRRCLLVRRPSGQRPEVKPARRHRGRPRKNAAVAVQQEFEFVEDAKGRRWDCFALVTNDAELEPVSLTQLYRDRVDCENNFDEYKSQWGWGGFVTHKIKPTRATARLTAIVANWWNVFCRLADGEKHMEPVTSRPLLLGIVGRIVTSGRKRFMHLTSTHAESSRIRHVLERIGAFLGRISANGWARRPSDQSPTAYSSSSRWLNEPNLTMHNLKPTARHRHRLASHALMRRIAVVQRRILGLMMGADGQRSVVSAVAVFAPGGRGETRRCSECAREVFQR